ncbi:MAG TPA: uroporphyrinogen decarboxylase [Thermoanaerobaculia bacterium]|nr:uroporphyrinogen decarboxylase [Thermoanaerobaculia bacterium]HUM30886.1 uroporphyrinogen decarboxylase [Thermoanaerobaculia bacterium]HXK69197.1 uroporphyrinogen decarboxylase [Thermoanaerobaculia bacterium]
MKKILRVLNGEPVSPPPVWLMRQAGRYMDEYQAIRKNHEFMDMCRIPEVATEVTLQPIRKFGMDAAILFSDILICLPPMGLDVRFEEGTGPIVQPLTSVSQLRSLSIPHPGRDLPFVLDTIRSLRAQLPPSCTLFGFAGAPFTLASYAIEGGSSKHFLKTKEWMYREPESFVQIMKHFADTVAIFLEAQAEAGAEVVQIFDSWGGCLTYDAYKNFALPFVQSITERLRDHVPVVYFLLNGAHLSELFPETGATAVSVGWHEPMTKVLEATKGRLPLQGNLDSAILFSSQDSIRKETDRILGEMKGHPHIFNLGHGVLPKTPVENVEFLVKYVQSR